MRTLLLFFALLFLSACAPKYKTVYSYIAPESADAQACVTRCKEQLAACRKVCEANYAICKEKAKKIAQKNYEAKLKRYQAALEQYTRDLERYNLRRDLFFYDDFCYFGRCGYYGPFGGRLLWGPPPVYTLRRPVKPSLQQEILDAELKHCRIDCGCMQSYDTCFEACGGKVVKKEVCIENCPE